MTRQKQSPQAEKRTKLPLPEPPLLGRDELLKIPKSSQAWFWVIATLFIAQGFIGIALYPTPWLRTVAVMSLCFGALGMIIFSRAQPRRVQENIIQYLPDATGLWFGLRSRFFDRLVVIILLLLATAFGGVASVFAVTFVDTNGLHAFWDFPKTAMVSIALVPLGLYALYSLISSLKTPVGLQLTPYGVNFLRERSRVEVTWSEVRKVSLQQRRNHQYVNLLTTDGLTTPIPSYSISSDPNIVAAIVRFYHEHPEHRDALETPQEALRRFKQNV